MLTVGNSATVVGCAESLGEQRETPKKCTHSKFLPVLVAEPQSCMYLSLPSREKWRETEGLRWWTALILERHTSESGSSKEAAGRVKTAGI